MGTAMQCKLLLRRLSRKNVEQQARKMFRPEHDSARDCSRLLSVPPPPSVFINGSTIIVKFNIDDFDY